MVQQQSHSAGSFGSSKQQNNLEGYAPTTPKLLVLN